MVSCSEGRNFIELVFIFVCAPYTYRDLIRIALFFYFEYSVELFFFFLEESQMLCRLPCRRPCHFILLIRLFCCSCFRDDIPLFRIRSVDLYP